jgi:hypothetical protein
MLANMGASPSSASRLGTKHNTDPRPQLAGVQAPLRSRYSRPPVALRPRRSVQLVHLATHEALAVHRL